MNALSIYHHVRRLGVPDHHIILMLAENVACDPRNAHHACLPYGNASHVVDFMAGIGSIWCWLI